MKTVSLLESRSCMKLLGSFSLYKLNLPSLMLSTQTFMLDFVYFLFPPIQLRCLCVCERERIIYFFSEHILCVFIVWKHFELRRAFCIFFSFFVVFGSYALNLDEDALYRNTWREGGTNHDHQWKVYFCCYVQFSTSSGCLKFGAFLGGCIHCPPDSVSPTCLIYFPSVPSVPFLLWLSSSPSWYMLAPPLWRRLHIEIPDKYRCERL